MTSEQKKRSISLLLAGFIIFSSLYVTQPIFNGLSHYFDVSLSDVSLTLSISTFMLGVGLVIVPMLNNIEKKRMMSISVLLVSILSLISVFVKQFEAFLVIRGLMGLVLSGVPSTAMAYIADEVHKDRVSKVMGLYVAGTTFGGMSGRVVVGILTDLFNWQIAIGTLSVINLIFAILMVSLLPVSKVQTPNWISPKQHLLKYIQLLKIPAVLKTMSLSFLLMGTFVTIYSYITVRFEQPPFSLSESTIAFIFILYLIGTYSSINFGKLSIKLGVKKAYALAITIMIVGIALTFITYLPIDIVGLAAMTFGFFGAHSIQSSYIATLTESSKSHASTLYLLGYYVGSSLLTILGGYIYVHLEWLGIGILSLLLTFIAVFISRSLFRDSTT
ncbi:MULTISPECIES: MFS transporter [Mammaliicoccus]|jgi:YNFM family putative membrane transporter|uniref:MFS transporter n=1 Tax=Mammaliicoccus lentus TaxID=42858 RepID=A0ABS6GW69_MAMLE|nr:MULTISPECIES: MFS transporter [Mammaliicoccus]MBF0749079.1 MFS transporter [Mammaliicoccus lentus]MBF0840533.1 MFS transporter [Mammaliicoccus lentus]MBU6113695.1 MFS transporter [Mammaliicoccus lentus]MBW0768842.1 MFS transporter [Mammaliicoccus lentus]MCD2476816.1 MFS transporter [Mammaliicoccus lentus]